MFKSPSLRFNGVMNPTTATFLYQPWLELCDVLAGYITKTGEKPFSDKRKRDWSLIAP
ncbi:hypothetical protein IHEIED_01838 [Methylorubrum populi]